MQVICGVNDDIYVLLYAVLSKLWFPTLLNEWFSKTWIIQLAAPPLRLAEVWPGTYHKLESQIPYPGGTQVAFLIWYEWDDHLGSVFGAITRTCSLFGWDMHTLTITSEWDRAGQMDYWVKSIHCARCNAQQSSNIFYTVQLLPVLISMEPVLCSEVGATSDGPTTWYLKEDREWIPLHTVHQLWVGRRGYSPGSRSRPHCPRPSDPRHTAVQHTLMLQLEMNWKGNADTMM